MKHQREVMLRGKKGQLSFFMIAGILILLLAGLIFYYKNVLVVRQETVNRDIAPIKTYVEACLETTAKDAITILGQQSGFIEIPREISSDSRAYISQGFYKMPLWYYETKIRIPPLTRKEGDYSIEEQMDRYIENNLQKCLDNFEIFNKKYDIAQSRILSKTTITDNTILLELDYPLRIEIRAGGEVSNLDKFDSRVDVRLKPMYELAESIMNYENQNMFFENMTVNLMSMSSDIPLTNVEIHCGYRRWLLSDIKNNLQDMIYYNMQNVRVDSTDYLPFMADESVYRQLSEYSMEDVYNGDTPDIPIPEDAYDYFNHFMRPKIKPTDLKVGVIYQKDYGIEVVARPSSNGILSASMQKGPTKYLAYLCLNLYHFTYDVVYPVQIAIRDDYAFNNKGYVFRFALPVLIDHNQGNRQITGHAVFNTPDTYVDYCADMGGQEYDIVALGVDEDGYTNQPLKDVNISYSCHKFVCPLGKTEAKEGTYKLKTELPLSCSYGYLVAEKEGYLKTEVQVLDDSDVDISMHRILNYNFDVVKHKVFENTIGESENLQPNEEAIIFLQNKHFPDYVIYQSYNGTFDSQRSIGLIELELGSYEVNVMLVDNADEKLIGGYKADINFTLGEISNKDKITFHVVEQMPKPFSDQKQYELIMYLEQDDAYKKRLRPTFSKIYGVME